MILISISIFILGQDHNSRISWIAKEIKVIFQDLFYQNQISSTFLGLLEFQDYLGIL